MRENDYTTGLLTSMRALPKGVVTVRKDIGAAKMSLRELAWKKK